MCHLLGVEDAFRASGARVTGKYGLGEGNEVEFKSSYVMRNDGRGPDLDYQGRGQVFEAVCGFLNANGGVLFLGVNDSGDPITAEGRGLFTECLREVARKVFIPLTVGGGINTLDDFDRVLKCGADKVSVNSGAVRNPGLIDEAARRYGSQCVVLSADVKRVNGSFHVFVRGGREDTGIGALAWLREGIDRGAGEIVLNSMDTDGVREGFDIEMLQAVCAFSAVPVIASGGAGKAEDFVELFRRCPKADAGLAASIFHYGEVKIPDVKKLLIQSGIPAREV